MEINKIYSFKELETALNLEEYNGYSFYRVLDLMTNNYALLTTFRKLFTEEWRAGDGILFYQTGKVFAAEPEDKFQLIEIIPISLY